MTVNLSDVKNCPVALVCDNCGSPNGLGQETVDTAVGVYCTTLCDGCVERGRVPSTTWMETVKMAGEHCGHLGIDADEMDRIQKQEART